MDRNLKVLYYLQSTTTVQPPTTTNKNNNNNNNNNNNKDKNLIDIMGHDTSCVHANYATPPYLLTRVLTVSFAPLSDDLQFAVRTF